MNDDYLKSDTLISQQGDSIDKNIDKLIKEGDAVILGRKLESQNVVIKTNINMFKSLLLDLPYRKKGKTMKLLRALSGLRWYSRKYLMTKSRIISDGALRHQIIIGKNILNPHGYSIISERKQPYRYRVEKIAPSV